MTPTNTQTHKHTHTMKTYKTNIKQFHIVKEHTDIPKVKITNSRMSADYIRQFYKDDIGVFESFFLLLLNRANITVGYAKISQGGIAGTVVDVSIIGKYMVENLASHAIIAHNHPSGSLSPSNADIQMTKKVQEAGKILDCELLDHIILTKDDYYSFADGGRL